MRTITGLERPAVQWTLVALCIVLIGVAVALAVALRRSSDDLRERNAESAGLRGEAERLDAQLVRERSTREALALELAKRRAATGAEKRTVPTLTLYPVERRTGQAPEPSVSAPQAEQVIELRLVLPEATSITRDTPMEVVFRDWANGKTIWSRTGLRAGMLEDRAAVIGYVTGDLLRPGSYEVVVRTESGQLAAYDLGIR